MLCDITYRWDLQKTDSEKQSIRVGCYQDLGAAVGGGGLELGKMGVLVIAKKVNPKRSHQKKR